MFKHSILIIFLLLVGCGVYPRGYEREFAQQTNFPSTYTEGKDGTVQFRFIDVGQGDATLLTTPNGKAILIDSGTPEMGRERVLPLLLETNVELELIIASHYDADHIGGIPEVIKGEDGLINTEDDIIPRMGVLDRGEVEAIDTTNLSDYFIITSGFRYSLLPGDEFVIDSVGFSILAQNGTFGDGYAEDINTENENAHSISLVITYKEINYLTSGDLPGPNFPNRYEPYDLESHLTELIDTVDILHVSHHGSHNSTSDEFVDAIRPRLAIISVGENDYGHPHPVVLKNLLDAGAEIHLTEGDWIEDKTRLNIVNGDVCLESNGEIVTVTSP